jgi:hydrogenase-4 component F
MITSLPFFIVVIAPLVGMIAAMVFSSRIKLAEFLSLLSGGVFLIATVLHALLVFAQPAGTMITSSLFLFDRLSASMTVIVGIVFFGALVASVRYLGVEFHEGHIDRTRIAQYHAFAHLFALAMVLALSANDLLFLWIAIEGSTLATTLLVAFSRKKQSLEAAWKYIVLCSTGLLLGLCGILILGIAALPLPSGERIPLLFSALGSGVLFDPMLLKLAFVFLFIGFGTKVGFVPMHTWLPDAHGETPAPISGILSGVLLSVALVTLLRFKGIVDVGLDNSGWTSLFFLVFGTISITYAALLMLNQQNYKRLLAYSSIEHMGLAAFGFALGPVGIAASLLHIAGHALTKPMLFFASGEIMLKYHTPVISQVSGLSRRLPKTSFFFFGGLLGLLAVPPSGLFISEIAILVAGARLWLIPTIIVLLALTVASYTLLKNLVTMTSEGEEQAGLPAEDEPWSMTHVVMIVQGLLLVGMFAVVATQGGREFLSSIVVGVVR